MNDITFRQERPEDYREVETLVRDSFWDVYRPGCLEHFVLRKLRDDPAFVPELDIVMLRDGRIIGQNVFVRMNIRADDGREIPILTMGPICIAPDLKRQGYGKMLLDYSLDRATEMGFGAVCFEGNIAFYGKSGFVYASTHGIRLQGLPADADASFFLSKELKPGYFKGVTGEFIEPDGYFVCDAFPKEFAAYEAGFPHRQKGVRSRQLCFVPPSPRPADPLLARSWDLRSRAASFLRSAGILEAWESIGADARLVGSFRSDLMMRDRDIDMHVYTPALDVPQTLQALAPVLASPRTIKMTFINGADTDEHCLEWHLRQKDDQGDVWTIDMIQILAGSRLDGHFEDIAEAIMAALTPETRRAILELKDATPADLHPCGIEYYKAVFADGVRTWPEFVQWRKSPNAAPDVLYSWKP